MSVYVFFIGFWIRLLVDFFSLLLLLLLVLVSRSYCEANATEEKRKKGTVNEKHHHHRLSELKRSLARWSDQIRTSWKQAKKNMLLFILRSSLSFLFAISMLWSITFLWVHLLVAARKIEPCMFFDCVKFQHYDLQRMQRNIIQINLK